MTESMSVLSAWESFYVIIGSSGGALIGLQFVVITLMADRRHLPTSGGVSAFGTPTVVHLAGALVISAIMSAPWPSELAMSALLAVAGLSGLAYGAVVVRRARRQTAYVPVWQDWLWYAALPGVSHAVLTIAALVLLKNDRIALFGIGAAALGLLLIGIHNAWDTVTHIVVTTSSQDK